MQIPSYWSEACTRFESPFRAGQEKVIRRWGWSEVNQAYAMAHAEERVANAKRDFLAGKPVAHRQAQHEYPLEDGHPIREEVVRRAGDVVITRNGYGALCLNTPNVLFADLDYPRPPRPAGPSRRVSWLGVAAGAALAAAGALFAGAAIATVGAAGLLAYQLKARNLRKGFAPKAVLLSRIESYLEQHPERLLHLYETPNGMRALVMDRTFDPLSQESETTLAALSNDPLFVRLCRQQQCFRARLTPKPWRVPTLGSARPPKKLWPLDAERLVKHREWVARYEAQTQGFAACRYLETRGNAPACAAALAVQAVHDEISSAHTSKPLA